jgi:DNA-binding transcriptional regulator YhcF (GntR family)
MLIDPKSPVPIFQQIAAQIRQQIASGVFKPNESLPSLRSLAADIHVNPNTVQRAYEELVREGLIESRRGAGLFVVERAGAAGANQAEKRIHRQLSRVISLGLREQIAPERLRTVFREALDSEVAAARRAP